MFQDTIAHVVSSVFPGHFDGKPANANSFVSWVAGTTTDFPEQDMVVTECVSVVLFFKIDMNEMTFFALQISILRKPAGRLGVVSPCERSEN